MRDGRILDFLSGAFFLQRRNQTVAVPAGTTSTSTTEAVEKDGCLWRKAMGKVTFHLERWRNEDLLLLYLLSARILIGEKEREKLGFFVLRALNIFSSGDKNNHEDGISQLLKVYMAPNNEVPRQIRLNSRVTQWVERQMQRRSSYHRSWLSLPPKHRFESRFIRFKFNNLEGKRNESSEHEIEINSSCERRQVEWISDCRPPSTSSDM